MATLTSSGIRFSSTDQITTRRWIFQGASDPGGANQTNWIFYQASAPTGWTKRTDHNNKALRVVSGSGGGYNGTQPFTTVCSSSFAYAGNLKTGSGVGYAVLQETMLPAHDHGPVSQAFDAVPAVYNPDGSFAYWNGGDVRRGGGYTRELTYSTGDAGKVPANLAWHFHDININTPISTTFTTGVRYIDIIVCSFNG